jgi:hypothetical protein
MGDVHGLALQHPGRGLLVEQRPKRRHQREYDQDAQHRAYAVQRERRMCAARAIQLHRGTDTNQRYQQAQPDQHGLDEAQ